MIRVASITLLSLASAALATACTCVSDPRATAKSQMAPASLVFRGIPLERKLLPQHPDMQGRHRYAVTFRVDESWKGAPAPAVILYNLEPGTDCHGVDYQVSREYLVYAVQQFSKDFKLEDIFWFGWTDIVAKDAPMLTSIVACMPVGETASRLVRKAIRELGPGRRVGRP